MDLDRQAGTLDAEDLAAMASSQREPDRRFIPALDDVVNAEAKPFDAVPEALDEVGNLPAIDFRVGTSEVVAGESRVRCAEPTSPGRLR